MCQSIFVNRSLKLKFTVNIQKKTPFSQNFKISCDDFESEKMFFLFTSLLLQIIEEFVIQVLSEFLITNSTTENNDFLEFVIMN